VAYTAASSAQAGKPRSARRAVVLLACALTLAAASPAGAVVVGGGPGGARVGIQQLAASGTFMDPAVGASSGVTYHGGPVTHGITTFAVFWDPAGVFPTSTEQLVAGYLAGSAHDSGGTQNVFSVAAQYTDGAGSAGYSQTYGGAFVDRDPYPTSGDCTTTTASASTCLNGSQTLSELEGFIAANSLPVGLSDVYILLTPDTVVTCVDGGEECSTNSYCSLHSYATVGSSTLLYIEIPFTLLDSASDAKSCQDDGNAQVQAPNADPSLGDVALKSLSHEELETISDPLLNAWYDANGNEIADLCNGLAWSPDAFLPLEGGSAAAGTLYNQTIAGAHYYLQGAWSDEAGGCALMSALTPTISGAPAEVERGVPLAISANAGTDAAIASYAWNFGDGQSASGSSVTHAYASAGVYTVALTVTDAFGNSGTVDEQVTVTAPGTTAGSSGSSGSRVRTTKHCGAVRSGKRGTKTKRCTTTKTTTVASGGLQRSKTQRKTCVYVRARGAHGWSRRACKAG
jgi:hypothetical protein